MAASARLIICLWICLTATVHAATRVALVSTCGGDAAGNVLALAEAKLAATTNIVLVERAQVERILNEQKLVRCGLSDSAQALAVGKLLGVEVFATLETFPGSQEMLGLVVFDARSGAKLWDAALPGGGVNVTAEALVEAVREACEKRLRSVGNRRCRALWTVSVNRWADCWSADWLARPASRCWSASASNKSTANARYRPLNHPATCCRR
jgi:hypothetical protein